MPSSRGKRASFQCERAVAAFFLDFFFFFFYSPAFYSADAEGARRVRNGCTASRHRARAALLIQLHHRKRIDERFYVSDRCDARKH